MTVSLRPYPEYVDSGVSWVGEVPQHWQMVPNRALLRLRKQVVGDTAGEYTLLSLTKQGIIPRDLENPQGKFPASFDSYQVVEPGDLVFCLFDIDETPRAVGLAGSRGMVTGAYTRFSCLSPASAPYVFSFYTAMDNGKLLKPLYTGLRKVIKTSTFLSAKMPSPPEREQLAIIRYLDYMDRRITRFIRVKQRLMALLNEQKQVTIDRAVTQGLDPNVHLKASGSVWLGDVPRHWDVRRLKSVARIRYGLGQPPRELQTGPPIIRATNVERGRIVEKDLIHVDPADIPGGRQAFLSAGEIIVVRSGAYTADSALIPKEYEGAVAGYDMVVTARHASPEFLALALLSTCVRDHQLITASMRSAQPHLNAEELGAALLPLPPTLEQERIVIAVARASAQTQARIAATKAEISLIREYRTRLVADVVTGKLDVREVAAQLPHEIDDDEALDDVEAFAEDGQPDEEGDLDAAPEEVQA